MFTQKKPAGLRKEGAALLLIGALLFGFGLAGCGEDPASADDIAKAVVQKQKEQQDAQGGESAAQTLQSVFEGRLDGSGKYEVVGNTAIAGKTAQKDVKYTVTARGEKLSVELYKSLIVTDAASGTKDSYTVTWTPKGTLAASSTNNMYDTYTLVATKVGQKAAGEVDFRIVNTKDLAVVIAGTVTLENDPPDTAFLTTMLNDFVGELACLGGGSNDGIPLVGMTAATPFVYTTWEQKAVQYAATMEVSATAARSLTLPSGDGNYTVTWSREADSAAAFTLESGNTVLKATTAAAANNKAVLKFTLKHAKVADKAVEGKLTITVKAAQ